VSGFYLGFAITYQNEPNCGTDLFNEQLKSAQSWQVIFDAIPHSVPQTEEQAREPGRSPLDSASDDPVILLGTVTSISSLKETTGRYQVVEVGSIQELRGTAESSTLLYDASRTGQLRPKSQLFMFITFLGPFLVLDHVEPLGASEIVYECLATPHTQHGKQYCSSELPGPKLSVEYRNLWSEYRCTAGGNVVSETETPHDVASEWRLTLMRSGEYSSGYSTGRFTVEIPDKSENGDNRPCGGQDMGLMLVFHTGSFADKRMPVCFHYDHISLPQLWKGSGRYSILKLPVRCVNTE